MNESQVAQIEETLAAWRELREHLNEYFVQIADTFVPVWESFVEVLAGFIEVLEREQLRHSLSRWLPDILASWLASHCPRRLLPKLKLEGMENV